MSSDRSLRQTIEAGFLHDPHLSAFGITVESINGFVTLKGTVSNARAKLAAQELASATPGCRAVFNEIAIEPAGGISDQQITDEIRALLDNHPGIVKGSITVRVEAGRVHLSGAVGSPEEYETAEDVARSARGVRGIHNLLLIDPAAQNDDESLQLEIESALAEIPDLRDTDIKVAVGGDLVILSGQVRDTRQRQLAEDAARSVRPWHVRNEIEILSPRWVPE